MKFVLSMRSLRGLAIGSLVAIVDIAAVWAQGGPPPEGTQTATYYATYKLDGGSSNQSNQTCVMIYQSMSGDASGTRGTFTMSGGFLT